jgi:hypothetical protein
MHYSLLTEGNVKTLKGQKKGFYSVILHLAPSMVSGYQVCPMASAGCIATCLNTAGRGGMLKAGEITNSIQEARMRRTRLFFEQRDAFMALLVQDIKRAEKRAVKLGMTLTVRLNGTSDLPWEKFRIGEHRNIMARFPHIQFYDYTKIHHRVLSNTLPSNYHLTYSMSEVNQPMARALHGLGHNVTVVVTPEVKAKALEQGAIDGDETDLRFLDGERKIITLSAKGKAKKDTTGFVIRSY